MLKKIEISLLFSFYISLSKTHILAPGSVHRFLKALSVFNRDPFQFAPNLGLMLLNLWLLNWISYLFFFFHFVPYLQLWYEKRQEERQAKVSRIEWEEWLPYKNKLEKTWSQRALLYKFKTGCMLGIGLSVSSFHFHEVWRKLLNLFGCSMIAKCWYSVCVKTLRKVTFDIF